MKITFRTISLAVLVTAALTLASCGGNWVELNTGMIENKCSVKEVEEIKEKALKGLARNLFVQTCRELGKEFADDIRCKDGRIEVKCQ